MQFITWFAIVGTLWIILKSIHAIKWVLADGGEYYIHQVWNPTNKKLAWAEDKARYADFRNYYLRTGKYLSTPVPIGWLALMCMDTSEGYHIYDKESIDECIEMIPAEMIPGCFFTIKRGMLNG